MTRLELVTEAAKQLGDTSTEFLVDVDAAFDWVLRDLASNEAISALKKTVTFALVQSQQDYNTRTITGLSAPDYPLEVQKLEVPAWGVGGLPVPRLTEEEFDIRRAMLLPEGRFVGWRVYPNETQIQVVPPAGAEQLADVPTLTYLAPPTILLPNMNIAEIRAEHLETVVFGIRARLAEFKEETGGDEKYWPLYLAGRNRMWGQRFNSFGGRIGVYAF